MNDYFATTDKLNNKHFFYSFGIVTYVKKHKQSVYFEVVLFFGKIFIYRFYNNPGLRF